MGCAEAERGYGRTFPPGSVQNAPSELAPRPDLEVKEGDLLFSRKNTHELVAA